MMPTSTGTRWSTIRTASRTIWSRRSSVENTTSPVDPRKNRPSTPASIILLITRSNEGTSSWWSSVSGMVTGGTTPLILKSAMSPPHLWPRGHTASNTIRGPLGPADI